MNRGSKTGATEETGTAGNLGLDMAPPCFEGLLALTRAVSVQSLSTATQTLLASPMEDDDMQIICEASDDALLKAQAYWKLWEASNPRNRLFLFDVLRELNEAETHWPAQLVMRPEWHELRRSVTNELCRLGEKLLAARTPEETDKAIFSKKNFRATVDRRNALNNLAIKVALEHYSLEDAQSTLKRWRLPRSLRTLQRLAYQMGLRGKRREKKTL